MQFVMYAAVYNFRHARIYRYTSFQTAEESYIFLGKTFCGFPNKNVNIDI